MKRMNEWLMYSLMILALVMAGCGGDNGISQSVHDALQADYDALQEEHEETEQERDQAQAALAQAQAALMAAEATRNDLQGQIDAIVGDSEMTAGEIVMGLQADVSDYQMKVNAIRTVVATEGIDLDTETRSLDAIVAQLIGADDAVVMAIENIVNADGSDMRPLQEIVQELFDNKGNADMRLAAIEALFTREEGDTTPLMDLVAALQGDLEDANDEVTQLKKDKMELERQRDELLAQVNPEASPEAVKTEKVIKAGTQMQSDRTPKFR